MPDSDSIKNDFLSKITGVIEENISNEHFGVSELANEIGMSRSNLLRKIKKSTNFSVSQFIRQVRLKNAMEMLRENDLTVSEVSYEVGFGSTSYFVKCFHDHYGYPPGEVSKRDFNDGSKLQEDQPGKHTYAEQSQNMGFWEELKRRKVVKVIIIYATITFAILQLLSVLIEPLYLPQWIMTLVIVLLAIGFPIAILFSWIFDITPSGIQKTPSINKVEGLEQGDAYPKKLIWFSVLIGVLLIVIATFAYPKIFGNSNQTKLNPDLEKSIAVLPFKNDSDDPSNVYITNGLMESILTNLQNINDLKVISRTSVEKYRTNPKTIPEISSELNVNYFVEGSGQKIGDKILLNIQLIDGSTDKHLWAAQYKRDTADIFELQQEVAKKIAEKIEAVITPEEAERIDKKPTDNLVAYDYFLKGLDQLHKGNLEGLEAAIPLFKKAIEHDVKFSLAYAEIALSYYYLDVIRAEKQYTAMINDYADKALSYDSKSPQGLIAKAMFYINNAQYEMAAPYLEKALQYNPNSALVIRFLSEYYTSYVPNTEKYLEYSLKGIQLDIASHDSITASYIYLHVSNAFVQSGFIKEAEKHIKRSLDYNPKNLFSERVRAFILYAKNKDLGKTKELLINAYQKDSTRLDILQEIGKICYYMRDYKAASQYYKEFTAIKKAYKLVMFPGEDVKIAVVFEKVGMKAESNALFNAYLQHAENDRSIYKDQSLAVYYSYKGDTQKAIEHLKLFSQQDNYHYWNILFLEMDPLVDNIKELPEFQQLMDDIETKFWANHKKIKATLEEKRLL